MIAGLAAKRLRSESIGNILVPPMHFYHELLLLSVHGNICSRYKHLFLQRVTLFNLSLLPMQRTTYGNFYSDFKMLYLIECTDHRLQCPAGT